MTELDYITSDAAVLHGQARINGTRIPVSVVLGCLAEGLNEPDIVREYPSLTPETIRAAAAYGARPAAENVIPRPPTGR